MELTKLQTIALVVLTTILTDKFLINHTPYPSSLPPSETSSLPTSVPTPILTQPATPTSVPVVLGANSQNEIILREITNLKKDIISTLDEIKKSSSDLSPLPTLSSSFAGGMVKISSSQWQKVDVFEKPLASSKIIGQIIYDTIYFYRDKQNNWYQLELDNNHVGWVQSQFLKEFP